MGVVYPMKLILTVIIKILSELEELPKYLNF